MLWIGEPGSLEHIGLPQVIGIIGFKAIQVVLVRERELSFGKSPGLEGSVKGRSAQQSWGSQLHVLHDGDEALDGSLGHLEFELAGLLDEIPGDGPDALIRPGFILEGLETASLIEAEPVADGLGFDTGYFSGLEHPEFGG